MIIDFHTHIFPPAIRDNRDDYLRRDPTFADMYANPRAKIATADDLLRSMDEAAVDVSVVLGFAWRDHDLCVQHNDYLLESAAKSNGRIIAFCTINPGDGEAAAKEIARCVASGAKGLGELRPESQNWDLNAEPGDLLGGLASQHKLILLFHVTEPGGYEYPGKHGLNLGPFFRFAVEHPELTIIGAHLAGGLPFAMPKARPLPHVYVDTAARRFLYDDAVYTRLLSATGAERILLASDFPLMSQAVQIAELRANVTDPDAQALIIGQNAARLLGLSDAP